jgi:hypothetical protein
MKRLLFLFPALVLPLLWVVASPADEKATPAAGAAKVTWKKIVLDRTFRSEGVAVADVNKDGHLDILAGDVWYENPGKAGGAWKMHVLREGPKYNPKGYDPHNYSQSFACWAEDLNGDGWPDLIVIGFPGEPCHWYENPGNKPGPWKEHMIWHSACNETPLYVDLLGTGKRVLVMGFQPMRKRTTGADGKVRFETTDNEGQMAYFTPAADPTAMWEMHPVSVPSTKGKRRPTWSAARPTTTASGGTSSGRARTARRRSFAGISSRGSFRSRTPCTAWTSTVTASRIW